MNNNSRKRNRKTSANEKSFICLDKVIDSSWRDALIGMRWRVKYPKSLLKTDTYVEDAIKAREGFELGNIAVVFDFIKKYKLLLNRVLNESFVKELFCLLIYRYENGELTKIKFDEYIYKIFSLALKTGPKPLKNKNSNDEVSGFYSKTLQDTRNVWKLLKHYCAKEYCSKRGQCFSGGHPCEELIDIAKKERGCEEVILKEFFCYFCRREKPSEYARTKTLARYKNITEQELNYIIKIWGKIIKQQKA